MKESPPVAGSADPRRATLLALGAIALWGTLATRLSGVPPLRSTALLGASGAGRITPLTLVAGGLVVGGALLGAWPAAVTR